MAPVHRRNVVCCAVAAAATLVLAGDAFVYPATRGVGLRSEAPRTVKARSSLQMTGNPRRALQTLAIAGSDGDEVVMVARSRTPITNLQRAPTYNDDERVEGATGAEEGLGEYDMSQFMTDGSAGGYQTYQQQETGERRNALDKRSQTLDRKNKFLLNAAVMTTIGAVGWVTVTSFLSRQADLIEAYADEMTYHVGDEQEMVLCHKEYKRKLGPGLYENSMYKEVMVALCQKPVTLDTARAMKVIFKLFRMKPRKALKQIMKASQETDGTEANARAKLYFFGSLLAEKDDKLLEILEPLKTRMERSYGVEGATIVKARMKEMAEAALKVAIESSSEPMLSGWQELGISDQRAAEIANEMNDEDSFSFNGDAFYKSDGTSKKDDDADPEDAAMLQQLTGEMEERKEEGKDNDPASDRAPMSYECTVCGYKMFVAQGREFKFFGDNFKCPECGAGKNKFKEGGV